MNKKNEIIDITTFTNYLTESGDATVKTTQLYRYLLENKDGIDNRCYVSGMLGTFELDIQQVIRGWYFVTCPGLRIYNQALTLNTAHKICSRYMRRITVEMENSMKEDYAFIWVRGAKYEESPYDSPDRLYGYKYFDERLGEPRFYLYQEHYEKTFIMKVSDMFVYIIDDSGMEHAVHRFDVYDKIMELCHEPEAEEEPEQSTFVSFWSRIKNFFC